MLFANLDFQEYKFTTGVFMKLLSYFVMVLLLISYAFAGDSKEKPSVSDNQMEVRKINDRFTLPLLLNKTSLFTQNQVCEDAKRRFVGKKYALIAFRSGGCDGCKNLLSDLSDRCNIYINDNFAVYHTWLWSDDLTAIDPQGEWGPHLLIMKLDDCRMSEEGFYPYKSPFADDPNDIRDTTWFSNARERIPVLAYTIAHRTDFEDAQVFNKKDFEYFKRTAFRCPNREKAPVADMTFDEIKIRSVVQLLYIQGEITKDELEKVTTAEDVFFNKHQLGWPDMKELLELLDL